MWFCFDAGSTGSLAGSVPFPQWKFERPVNGSSTSMVHVRSPPGFFHLTNKCCFGYWAVEDFTTIGTLDLKKSYHHSGPSSMRPNELWTNDTSEPPGQKPLVVNVVVARPFEKEEEGTGIASDIVKVKGEDPETPGYRRGGRVRRDVGDLGSWVHLPWLAQDETPGP